MNALLTVVVPVRNESANIEELSNRIKQALNTELKQWDLLFVDDASTDGTFETIKKICRKNERIKCLRLAESVGQECAILAGIRCSGDGAVIVMDGDLQDPPELIPKMLQRWKEGYDTVLTKRSSRKGEEAFKRISAKLFYSFVRALGRKVAEGNYCLIGEKAVKKIQGMSDPFPMIRMWVPAMATKFTTLTYDRQPRRAGKSKYNLLKMYALAMDGITGSMFQGRLLVLMRSPPKTIIEDKVNM